MGASMPRRRPGADGWRCPADAPASPAEVADAQYCRRSETAIAGPAAVEARTSPPQQTAPALAATFCSGSSWPAVVPHVRRGHGWAKG